MERIASKRPSPALVLSMITLLLAITSTAGALPGKDKVRKGDIANGAVTGAALSRGAVKASAIAPRAVTSKKLANDSVVSRTLAPFSVGAFAFGNTTIVSAAIQDVDATLDFTWSTSPRISANCPPNSTLLGGGVSITDSSSVHRAAIQTSAPNGNQWLGAISTDTAGAAPGTVYAICLL